MTTSCIDSNESWFGIPVNETASQQQKKQMNAWKIICRPVLFSTDSFYQFAHQNDAWIVHIISINNDGSIDNYINNCNAVISKWSIIMAISMFALLLRYERCLTQTTHDMLRDSIWYKAVIS